MKFAHIRVSEYFTFAEQIFHSEAISLARRANFIEKSTCLGKCFFLAGIVGLEPTHAGVKVLCLYRLGYIPLLQCYILYHDIIPCIGAFVNSHFQKMALSENVNFYFIG